MRPIKRLRARDSILFVTSPVSFHPYSKKILLSNMMSIATAINSIMTVESGYLNGRVWTNCMLVCSTAYTVVQLALFAQQRFFRRQDGLALQGLFLANPDYNI